MKNDKKNLYSMPFIALVLCFSMVAAQETFTGDDPIVAEMMNDKAFQRFLRTTDEAFPPYLIPRDEKIEPVIHEESENLSLYRQLRRQQTEENERNRDTIGYKRREYDFHFPGVYRPTSQRPLSVGVKIDMRQGDLRETGEDFDLAVEGNGFFRVTDQEEVQKKPEILYTRSGSFERDAQGYLSLIQGERVFRLTPEILVPAEIDSFRVDEDGQIHVTTETDNSEQKIGHLELAIFLNSKRLCPVDDRCFSETPFSGKPKIRRPAQGTAGKIRQRFLEESNVQ